VNRRQPPTIPSWLTRHQLDATHCLYSTHLPSALTPSQDTLREIWALHPAEFPEFTIHGRVVQAPRWQQAYGADYHYTGSTNSALPIPPILEPLRG